MKKLLALLLLFGIVGCSDETEKYDLDGDSDEYLEFLEQNNENSNALEETKVSTYLHCPLEQEYLNDRGIESKFYLVELNTINDKPTKSIIHFGADDVDKDSIDHINEYFFLYAESHSRTCELYRNLEDRNFEICKDGDRSDFYRKTLTMISDIYDSDLRDDIPTYGDKCIYFKKRRTGFNPEYKRESYDQYLGIHRESLKMSLSNQACGIPSFPTYNGAYQCKIISKDEFNKIKFDFHRQLDLYIKARQKHELLRKESIKRNKI